MRIIFLLIFFFTFTILVSQQSASDSRNDTTPLVLKNKYLKFLFLPDSTSQARMFMVGIQYLNTPSYETFKTNGLHVLAGFNLARFFSKKFILGLVVDVKPVKGFTTQRFSNEFVNDFNNNFITNYSSQEDSAIAYVLKSQINISNGMQGNYFSNFGITLSLFPQKFGGIMVMVKKGIRSYRVTSIYGNKFIGNGEIENAYIDFNDNYSAELTMKPYALFKNSFFPAKTKPINEIAKLLTLSFYYEQTNLRGAKIAGLPLENIVMPAFLNKYGSTNSYGFKIGLLIY